MIHALQSRKRTGAVIVLTAVMMIVMFALLAFAVDIGYLVLARTELQSAADSASLAGTWDLLNSHFVDPEVSSAVTLDQAKTSAKYYVTENCPAKPGESNVLVNDADIRFGRLDLSAGPTAVLNTTYDPNRFNAVQVQVKRTTDRNGEVPLFFARIMGIDTAPSGAVAMAAYSDNIVGFKPPAAGTPNLPILPFALDQQSWNEVLAETSVDHWSWNPDTGQVSPGQDGIHESSIYPQDTGSPSNRGTVDIGNPNNSTKDLTRQIREGITAEDLSYLPGGKLEFGPDGTLLLTGDTGMSGGIKDDLGMIVGQTRVIPIFSSVAGNGNNAVFTIVRFAGVRVMAVNLTGKPSSRYVVIQPAKMQIDNGIPGPDNNQSSDYLYSKRIWLVR